MARRKSRHEDAVQPEAVDAVPGRAVIKVTAKCPGCGSLYTARRGESGGVQYRECKSCGRRFKVDLTVKAVAE